MDRLLIGSDARLSIKLDDEWIELGALDQGVDLFGEIRRREIVILGVDLSRDIEPPRVILEQEPVRRTYPATASALRKAERRRARRT